MDIKKRDKWLVVFLVLVNITYLNNGFVWLDHNDLEQKFAVLNLSKIPQAFTTPFGQTSFYRPLVVVSNSLDYALYDSWALGFHFTNLVLYFVAIGVGLKFLTQVEVIKDNYLIVAAAFFAVHPLTILIKGPVVFRQEIMLVIFIFASLYSYLKAKNVAYGKYKLLSVSFYILSLLTKETALILPLVVGFWEVTGKFNLRQCVKWVVILFIPTVIYLYGRHLIVTHWWGTPYPSLTVEENVATRVGLMGKMFKELIWPVSPSFSDSTRILHFSDMQVVLTTIGLIGISLYFFRNKFKSLASRLFALTIIFLLPGVNLVPVPRISSPHYAYLALIPFIGFLIESSQTKKLLARLEVRLVVLIWLVIASYQTFTYGLRFNNDETLFLGEVIKNPNFVEANYYLGNYYLKNLEFPKAVERLELAAKEHAGYLIFKDQQSILVNLAAAYIQTSEYAKAQNLYDQIYTTASPSLQQYILFNQALIAFKKQDPKQVIVLLANRDWQIPQAYLLLADAYHQIGNTSSEKSIIMKALPLVSIREKTSLENYLNLLP